ncbi:ABC transporter [Apiospora phragmitis]|uniref:ABC transporter n=1 Tax=Apiospora phragmitis TaxID=2905665 RepID=A0ABR1VER5_9PEZI
MAFLSQIWTLTSKNLKIVLVRHPFATVIRAFVLPILLAAFLSFARNLFVPPAVYGIQDTHNVRSLPEALDYTSGTDREIVVLVNNGHAGGDIDRVIDQVADVVTGAGKNATRLSDPADIGFVCKSSLRAVTGCYGAVVFESSPSEGARNIWNYTLRADGALGGKIDTTKDTNDAEIYTLPLQKAVDSAIGGLNGRERSEQVRQLYQQALVNFLAVAFIATIIGVCYHMTGFMATEREIGMSQLLDAMMPTKRLWEAQVARLLSHHIAFTAVYLPGWIIAAIIIGRGVFASSNVGVLIVHFLLSGLALASMSTFGSAFFKRSQLSGVVSTIAYILLAILAQALTAPNSAVVIVLSLLFTPCNFVWFLTYVARYQKHSWPTDLVHSPPDSPWELPGIVFWVFLVIQIFCYPVLGAYLERVLHGTTTKGRTILRGQDAANAPQAAVRLEKFTKIYKPSALRRLFSFISPPREDVVAVNELTLSAERGQILALLGANGSGKSTTLDSIAGISKLSSGNITIDGTGGLGIAPQKNVLWDELTVFEHIHIFNRLKAPGNKSSKAEIKELVHSVDLGLKIKAMSKTLSGGQKRKLQLGMMLTGGSAVCCVDEVSSGIDPLSRRKVWDILLAERGKRTIIMTTHFLDEADLLADQLAILSKGTLRAQGSSVELKDRLGAGYRIHVFNAQDVKNPPEVEGVTRKVGFDNISYIAQSSAAAAEVIRTLEAAGISDYKYSGPTIEDVFLQVAEEVHGEDFSKLQASAEGVTDDKQVSSENVQAVEGPEKDSLALLSGKPIGFGRQFTVLFKKRITILKTNWFPYFAAFFIPIVAAGLVMLFIKGQSQIGCTPSDQSSSSSDDTFQDLYDNITLVVGPAARTTEQELTRLLAPILFPHVPASLLAAAAGSGSDGNGSTALSFLDKLITVDSLDDFNDNIEQHRKNVTPGGYWLGDSNSPPTLAYLAEFVDLYSSVATQNLQNIMLVNTTIATTFKPFDSPFAPGMGNSLQVLVYMCLALSAFPAFFGLYPNIERRHNVRGLQYSNGVRSLPLWVAYLAFDFAIVLVSTAFVIIIFATLSSVWYHVGYLFLIFMLYGLASTLFAYVISLFCKTQLSAYAFAAAIQVVGFLIYLIAYLCVITYAPANKIDEDINLAHFIISAFIPIGSIVRTLFIALNLFSAACDGFQLAPNPAAITVYGGPILYLIIQSFILFGILIWYDSGAGLSIFHKFTRKPIDAKADETMSDDEVANELTRVTTSSRESDGLQVVHLTKTFKKNTAVDNVTFGVQHSEVFALLGPNGAGKSTTISLIRGDIQPSRSGGDIFVENVSVSRKRAAARANLGVCPQFDAIDSMTVLEHLRFYANIRGIPDVEHNVRNVLRAVGLEAFSTRQAHALSGGNKRKLSLGIALMGNPSVVLLDEPSSGLDAAAKRIMWKTLASIVPGRSILLTTHSMEEADALANRAGILAKRMLAMGPVENLRQRFGDALYVHLVSRTAPHSTPEEMERVKDWVKRTYPGADVEEKTYHGQLRFSVPASAVLADKGDTNKGDQRSAVGHLIIKLEEQKESLGIEHYSVSPTTLDQVFLTIVGKHNVKEEGHEETKPKSWWRCGF